VTYANAVRVAPGRNRRPVCYPWKFYAQGSEYYCGARTAIGDAKFSFLSRDQVFTVGNKRQRLAAPAALLSDETTSQWLRALQIKFLIPERSILPAVRAYAADFVLAETPLGSKLVLDLYVRPPSASRLPTPTGDPLWNAPLRDGREVLLLRTLRDLDESDRATIERARVLTFQPPNQITRLEAENLELIIRPHCNLALVTAGCADRTPRENAI
jgi:hypothetical protein